MYIDVDSLKAIASVITALTVIGSALVAAVKWYLKQKELEENLEEQKEENQQKLDELREEHVRDIKKLKKKHVFIPMGFSLALKVFRKKDVMVL